MHPLTCSYHPITFWFSIYSLQIVCIQKQLYAISLSGCCAVYKAASDFTMLSCISAPIFCIWNSKRHFHPNVLFREGVNIPVLVGQIFRDLFRFIPVYSGCSGILFRIFRDFFKGNCMDLGTHFLKSKIKCSKMAWLVPKMEYWSF